MSRVYTSTADEPLNWLMKLILGMFLSSKFAILCLQNLDLSSTICSTNKVKLSLRLINYQVNKTCVGVEEYFHNSLPRR
jgi:hypothetical protein